MKYWDKMTQYINFNEAEYIADSRNGFIEFDVCTVDGEYSWPFSNWDFKV